MKIFKIAKYGDQVKKLYLSQGFRENVVDYYISEFSKIRQQNPKELYKPIPNVTIETERRNDISAYREFKQLENIVDYVKGQRQLEPNSNIEHNTEMSPIYNQNGLKIYKANSAQDCIQIKGNDDASWCVAQPGSANMYSGYRFTGEEPTFYFIKDENRSDKYSFCALQVKNDGSYTLTSHKNDGDIKMKWNEITQIIPKLTPLQDLFVNIPLSEKEKRAYDKFSSYISDEDFIRLSFEDKKTYLDVTHGQNITDKNNKFQLLPDELKNYWMGFGYGLTDKQFALIKDNNQLIKRYKELTQRKVKDYINTPNLRKQIVYLNSELEILDPLTQNNLFENMEPETIASTILNSKNPVKTFQLLKQENIDKLDSASVRAILYNIASIHSPFKNPEQKIQVFQALGKQNIDKLQSEDVLKLLKNTVQEGAIKLMTEMLGDNINKLSESQIMSLLENQQYHLEPLMQALKNNLHKLSRSNISRLMRETYYKNEVVKALGENIYKLMDVSMSRTDAFYLLAYSENIDKAVQILGPHLIKELLAYPKSQEDLIKIKKDPMADLVLKTLQEQNMEIEPSTIFTILLFSKDIPRFLNILGSKNVNKLNFTQYSDLYHSMSTENRQLLKQLRSQYTPKSSTMPQNPNSLNEQNQQNQQKEETIAQSYGWYKLSQSSQKYNTYQDAIYFFPNKELADLWAGNIG